MTNSLPPPSASPVCHRRCCCHPCITACCCHLHVTATIVITCASTGNAASAASAAEVPQDLNLVIETFRECELSADLAIACGEYFKLFCQCLNY